MGDSKKVGMWLNMWDYIWVTNNGAHITPSLLISYHLELNSFHGLPYHTMSYLIIDWLFGVRPLSTMKKWGDLQLTL